MKYFHKWTSVSGYQYIGKRSSVDKHNDGKMGGGTKGKCEKILSQHTDMLTRCVCEGGTEQYVITLPNHGSV